MAQNNLANDEDSPELTIGTRLASNHDNSHQQLYQDGKAEYSDHTLVSLQSKGVRSFLTDNTIFSLSGLKMKIVYDTIPLFKNILGGCNKER